MAAKVDVAKAESRGVGRSTALTALVACVLLTASIQLHPFEVQRQENLRFPTRSGMVSGVTPARADAIDRARPHRDAVPTASERPGTVGDVVHPGWKGLQFRPGLVIPGPEEIGSELHPPSPRVPETESIPERQLCIGIPSAHRNMSGLLDRMRKLRAEVDPDTTPLVFLQTYTSRNDAEDRKSLEEMGFQVVVDKTGHPSLADATKLKLNFGDPVDRVRWRAGHVLDYANALEACYRKNTSTILMVEDDLWNGYQLVQRMTEAVARLPRRDYGFVTLFSHEMPLGPGNEFRRINGSVAQMYNGGDCGCGAVALLYRREVVAELIAVLRANAQERPVDWLIPGWLCGSLQLPCYEVTPNLFQHLGTVSTFAGQARSFARSKTFRPHGRNTQGSLSRDSLSKLPRSVPSNGVV